MELPDTYRQKARKIAEKTYGPIPKGYHVHHIDENYMNNAPENLLVVSPLEHPLYHRKNGPKEYKVKKIVFAMNKDEHYQFKLACIHNRKNMAEVMRELAVEYARKDQIF